MHRRKQQIVLRPTPEALINELRDSVADVVASENTDLPKSGGRWEDRFKALASMSMDEVKHQAMKSLNGDVFRSMRAEKEALAQRRAQQLRLSANEQLLQDTLSAM